MKPSPLRRCLAGLGILLLVLPAFAATRSSSPAPSLPPTLTALVKAGKVKVVNQFATDVPGLTGYIVTNQDGTQVVYGDGGYLIVGHVISPKGTDLTDDYRERYSPQAGPCGDRGQARRRRASHRRGPHHRTAALRVRRSQLHLLLSLLQDGGAARLIRTAAAALGDGRLPAIEQRPEGGRDPRGD